MTLKAYVWGMRLVTLFSMGALIFVVEFVDPDSSGIAGKLIFYLSLFFVLSGFFNLLLLRLRRKSIGIETGFINIRLSFRQGILLSCFAIGLLLLQSYRILVWWDGLLLLAGIFIVELYFVSGD